MAIKLARKYSTFYEFDDLFQIAQISIVEAVRSYDSKRGASLSTHIYNSIDFNIKKLNIENMKKSFNVNEETKKIKSREIVALIAYLQRLGKDISGKK